MDRRPCIRLAGPGDIPAISALLRRLTRVYIAPGQSPQALAHLIGGLGPCALHARLRHGHRIHVAEVGDALAAVAATRDDSHLSLLFVDTPFQRMGLARRLWRQALDDCLRRAAPRAFTVNASARAVPVYLKLGFEVAGRPRDLAGGVVATPMIYRCSTAGSGA